MFQIGVVSFRRNFLLGFFHQADYAVLICRAFNDYVLERYRKIDPRLYPMGLIAMQSVKEASKSCAAWYWT